MEQLSFDEIKFKLDYHYSVFGKKLIEPDPLQFLHKFDREEDIELIGYIASMFAFGNVKQIIKSLEKICAILGKSPAETIRNLNNNQIEEFRGVVHRFISGEDTAFIFRSLNSVYKTHGTIKNLFYEGFEKNGKNIKKGITAFSEHFLSLNFKENRPFTQGTVFMFPLPEKGSACKRFNLFLRWMVRKDELDFGFWSEVGAENLIIPVDTHIAKIGYDLGFTKRKNVTWLTAEDITNSLKKFDEKDPVKYDFALCHLGMRKLQF